MKLAVFIEYELTPADAHGSARFVNLTCQSALICDLFAEQRVTLRRWDSCSRTIFVAVNFTNDCYARAVSSFTQLNASMVS